jgi:hypothetical protein
MEWLELTYDIIGISEDVRRLHAPAPDPALKNPLPPSEQKRPLVRRAGLGLTSAPAAAADSVLSVLNRRARVTLRGRVAIYIAGGPSLLAFCASSALNRTGRASENATAVGQAPASPGKRLNLRHGRAKGYVAQFATIDEAKEIDSYLDYTAHDQRRRAVATAAAKARPM